MDSTVSANVMYGQSIQVQPVQTTRLEIGPCPAAGTDVHPVGY